MNSLLKTAWKALQGGSLGALIVAGLLLAANLYIFFGTVLPTIQAFRRGVQPLTAAEIAAMQSVDNRFQVYHFTVSDAADTGFNLTTNFYYGFADLDVHSRGYYGLFKIGDHVLLVDSAAPIDASVHDYTGTFGTYVNKDILAGLLEKYPNLESA